MFGRKSNTKTDHIVLFLARASTSEYGVGATDERVFRHPRTQYAVLRLLLSFASPPMFYIFSRSGVLSITFRSCRNDIIDLTR